MIYHVKCMTDSPHWSTAYVEADNPAEALIRLHKVLKEREHDEESTVWEGTVLPYEDWVVTPKEAPFIFILGPGCR